MLLICVLRVVIVVATNALDVVAAASSSSPPGAPLRMISLGFLNFLDLNAISKLKQLPSASDCYTDTWSVDSGAGTNVLHEDRYPDCCVTPTIGSQNGVKCTAANGQRIADLGSKKSVVLMSNGSLAQVDFSVCDVHKPLSSVAHMIDQDNIVIFPKPRSWIVHPDGERA